MKKWGLIAFFVLLLLAVAVLANVLTPEPWREHVLNVSELFGVLIALLGVPYLVHELAGLKNRTVSATDLRKTLEKSLKEKIEEWFPPDVKKGRQLNKVANHFDVHIVDNSKSWEDLLRSYEPDAIKTWTPNKEEKNYYFDENKLHIRAQYEDQSPWVVCWSKCQRFCSSDAKELEEKLKTLPECRIFRELSKLLSKNSTP